MKPETAEWTSKADADLATAQREAAVADAPNYRLGYQFKVLSAFILFICS